MLLYKILLKQNISQHRFYQNGTCFRSLKPSSGVHGFKFTGKCNYIKLPSQYLWDNTSLQKNFLFLALQSLADHKPETIAIHVLGPATYASIFLQWQIIVHAGLSPLFPSGFRLRKVLKIIVFKGWGCQPHTQPPNWFTRVSLLVWVITLTCLAWKALPVGMLPPT